MNKKIIAIAIASALTAPAAMADMSITGQLGAALVFGDSNSVPTPTAGGFGLKQVATDSYRGMQDSGLSKLDFKGTAGNAYTHIGMDIRGLMAGDVLSGRDLYLGYKFDAGSLQFGRMPSALAGLEKDKYNATFLEMRRTAAVASTKDTLTDSFTASPVIQWAMKAGPANVKVQYDPGDNTTSTAAEGYTAISVAGNAGPVAYFVGWNNGMGTEGVPANKDTNTKIGASMKFGAVKATLVIMNADNDGVKDDSKALLADMDLGSGLSAGIGYGTNKAKDTWTRLAVTKSLDKSVRIFGGLTSKKAGGAANRNGGTSAGTTFGAGMAIKF